jgi:hypothetical protein
LDDLTMPLLMHKEYSGNFRILLYTGNQQGE